MKEATHVLVSFTDTQHFSWSVNSIHLLYNITYERIKDKAYRGILAVVRIKTEGTTFKAFCINFKSTVKMETERQRKSVVKPEGVSS